MAKKIFKILSYILIGLLVIVNLTILGMKLVGEEPSIFGYHIYYIASGSMEPTINTGEVIVGKEVDIEDLEVEDIVTFYGTNGSLKGKIITHRIIKVYEEDGQIYIVTKGDATGQEDDPIPATDVISVMLFKIPLVGEIVKLISNKYGFLFIIVIPLGIILVKQVIDFVKAIKTEESEDTEKLNENEE